jgi:hypothetical protein
MQLTPILPGTQTFTFNANSTTTSPHFRQKVLPGNSGAGNDGKIHLKIGVKKGPKLQKL